MAAFNVKKKQEFDELRSKYRNELKRAKREVERLIKVLRDEGPKPHSVRKARDFFEAKLRDEPSSEAYHPGVGELVRIRELRRIGQVVAQKGSKYKISLQNIYYWVEPTDIESIKEDKGNQN